MPWTAQEAFTYILGGVGGIPPQRVFLFSLVLFFFLFSSPKKEKRKYSHPSVRHSRRGCLTAEKVHTRLASALTQKDALSAVPCLTPWGCGGVPPQSAYANTVSYPVGVWGLAPTKRLCKYRVLPNVGAWGRSPHKALTQMPYTKTMSITFEALQTLLAYNKAYLTQDGEINTMELHKKAQECDRDLLALLVNDDDARNEFFFTHGEHTVFLRDRFIDYIEHKNFLANSYTRYKNKIGLHDERDYLRKRHEVVLAFPFKDCVLEGGQTADSAKRTERYYNRVLASKAIDRLFDPKMLTNARRYTRTGAQTLTHFTRNTAINEKRGTSTDTITDNLIIKGNNVIALHTLTKQFAGKVKLIYIDPPYNTGNDSFGYNDNFNHSTWLVFMKNRLEVARQLLREDGVIFVQCDDNEQAYLKVLMDEVFGRENFIATAPRKTGAGSAATRSERELRRVHDFIQIYMKSKNGFFLKRLIGVKEFKERDEFGLFTYGQFQVSGSAATRKERPNMYYPIYLLPDNTLTTNKMKDYIKEILPKKINEEDGRWLWNKDKFEKDNKKYIVFDGNTLKRKIYKNEVDDLNVYQVEKAYFENCTNKEGTMHLNEVFGKKNLFPNPKPEKLLERIMQIATQEGDIVLDYHLGSGTTAAVAHKMGRQYIGVEQMDYIENIAVERLKKVIEGEQGGISAALQWKGGGDFVYLELKAHNAAFIERIGTATTTEELLAIQADILANAEIDYRFNAEAVTQSAEEFAALSQEQQKQTLIDFLELNQLYVAYTERGDTRFACTADETRVSEQFYNPR